MKQEPQESPSSRPLGQAVSGITLPAVLPLLLLSLLGAAGFLLYSNNPSLFHILFELLSVFISLGIFLFCLYTPHLVQQSYFLLLSFVFLLVGSLDLLHGITFPGLELIKSQDPYNLSAQYSLSARLVEALAFLAAPYVWNRRLPAKSLFLLLLVGGGGFIWSLQTQSFWPEFHLIGRGNTLARMVAEYAVCFLFFLAVYLHTSKKLPLHPDILWRLISAILLALASQIILSFFSDQPQVMVVLGHFFKILSLLLLFQVFAEVGIRQPSQQFKDNITQLHREIDRRQKAQSKLAANNLEYEQVLLSSMDGFCMVDADGQILRSNPALSQLLNLFKDDLVGRNLFDFFAPHLRTDARLHMDRAKAKNRYRFESVFVAKGGRNLTVEVSMHHFLQEGKSHYFSFVRDVSEKIRLDVELLKQQKLFSTALGYLPLAVYLKNHQGRYIYANPEAVRMISGGEMEVLGRSDHEFFQDEILEVLHQEDRQAWKSQELFTCEREQRFLGKNRSLFIGKKVIQLENQEKLLLGFALDLTDQKALELETVRLAQAVEQTGECIIMTDREGRIERVNQSFERSSGFKASQVLGQRLESFFSFQGEGGPWSPFGPPEPWRGRVEMLQRQQGEVMGDLMIAPLFHKEGGLLSFIAFFRDMTYERQLEKKLLQKQKMEAIGTLAGGIAHDFNNLLFGILLNVKLIKQDLPPESPTQEFVQQALLAGKRAKGLIKQILTFSRQNEQKLEPVQVVAGIKESIKMMRSILPANVEITSFIDVEEARIMADHTQIHQVMMNLCANAAYAMRLRGGKLEISITREDLSYQKAKILEMEPGPSLCLKVMDQGEGMEEQVKKRIFEPFFTTKPLGEGSGMGLSVVLGIIQHFGGSIQCESSPGLGSVFTIHLPLLPQVEDAPQPVAVLNLPSTRAHLLVVDDEEILTQATRIFLERLGYQVSTASNGEQALRMFHQQANQISLVLTDQMMPQMTGLELAASMLKIKPGLPVLIATGNPTQLEETEIRRLGICEVIEKPLDEEALAHKIYQLLTLPS